MSYGIESWIVRNKKKREVYLVSQIWEYYMDECFEQDKIELEKQSLEWKLG